jgi:hypothetical protein
MNSRCYLDCPIQALSGKQASEALDSLHVLTECIFAAKQKELIEYWEIAFPEDPELPDDSPPILTESETDIPF